MIYILSDGKAADRESVERMTMEEAEAWLCLKSYESYITDKQIEEMKSRR